MRSCGMGSLSNESVLVRGRKGQTETQREEGHVKTVTAVMQPQAKERLGPAVGKDSLLEPSASTALPTL